MFVTIRFSVPSDSLSSWQVSILLKFITFENYFFRCQVHVVFCFYFTNVTLYCHFLKSSTLYLFYVSEDQNKRYFISNEK